MRQARNRYSEYVVLPTVQARVFSETVLVCMGTHLTNSCSTYFTRTGRILYSSPLITDFIQGLLLAAIRTNLSGLAVDITVRLDDGSIVVRTGSE